MRFASLVLLGAALLCACAAAPQVRLPPPGSTVRVTATAYCHRGTTGSGTRTHTGIIAADPRVFPLGSVVRIVDGRLRGIYTVMDTGASIRGRRDGRDQRADVLPRLIRFARI